MSFRLTFSAAVAQYHLVRTVLFLTDAELRWVHNLIWAPPLCESARKSDSSALSFEHISMKKNLMVKGSRTAAKGKGERPLINCRTERLPPKNGEANQGVRLQPQRQWSSPNPGHGLTRTQRI